MKTTEDLQEALTQAHLRSDVEGAKRIQREITARAEARRIQHAPGSAEAVQTSTLFWHRSAVELAAALPDDIRAAGWSVAVHNDYRLNGQRMTFWLFTKGCRAVKGEGATDREALDQIRAQLAEWEEELNMVAWR